MKAIHICIGSTCYLKHPQDVIEIFESLIKTYHLEKQLELKAAFCMGHCTQAITVKKWDGSFLSVDKNNANEIFLTDILPYL